MHATSSKPGDRITIISVRINQSEINRQRCSQVNSLSLTAPTLRSETVQRVGGQVRSAFVVCAGSSEQRQGGYLELRRVAILIVGVSIATAHRCAEQQKAAQHNGVGG